MLQVRPHSRARALGPTSRHCLAGRGRSPPWGPCKPGPLECAAPRSAAPRLQLRGHRVGEGPGRCGEALAGYLLAMALPANTMRPRGWSWSFGTDPGGAGRGGGKASPEGAGLATEAPPLTRPLHWGGAFGCAPATRVHLSLFAPRDQPDAAGYGKVRKKGCPERPGDEAGRPESG